jgi:Protein of unknown function (DUF3489)
MKTFTIDAENNITAHGSAEEAVAGAERFTTEGELNKLAAGWHSDGLVEIWNSLPGATPVKKFKDRKTAVSRVWKAIAGLGETKAPVAPQKPSVAPAKGKSAQNATPAKKGPKAPKGGKKADKSEKPTKARQVSKTAQVLELLKRPGGATLKGIMAKTGWQAHSVRGFISGTLGKKMGLAVESAKGGDGERTYSTVK